MTFGSRLGQLAFERELTWGQISYKSGLHENALYRLRRNARRPRLDTMLKLAAAFNMTLSEFPEGVDR